MTQPVLISDPPNVPESRARPISSRGLRFLCRLGQGGMAEVHLANAAPINTAPNLVVVKRMHQQHVDDPATVRMFLDEARLALCLSHPNIVRSDRVGMFDGRHGIVMEFLEGQPFHHVLKRAWEREASMSLELVAQVAMAALDALHYAHELKDVVGNDLGIVHRDISPQNIFISYDGAVKLLDFGIAKNAMQDGRTRTGLLKGKVSYMAPEQARGEDLDRRADLWSLGVVLWEAVTGSRLFKGTNEAAALNMTLTGEIAAPSVRRPDLPPELESILLRALKRDPLERYATAAAMRDDLETWLSNREVFPSASLSQLMQRLFGKEMRDQDVQLNGLLSAQSETPSEAGTAVFSPLGGSSVTLSSVRGTQVSTVTDLMDELTRQRRVTTRLLGGLMALVGIALLAGLYFLLRVPQVSVTPNATTASEAPPLTLPANRPATEPTKPAVVAPAPAIPAPTIESTGTSPAAPPATRAWATTRAPASDTPRASKAHRRAGTTGEPTSTVADTAAAAPETGLLNLDTTPWSVVSVGGRVLGQTPIVGASLPAGTHTLVLSNPELGLKTSYQVTITARRTTARRIGLD